MSANEGSTPCPTTTTTTTTKRDRKLAREDEDRQRRNGKLIRLRFEDVTCWRNGVPDFIQEHLLFCVRGSKSQFNARTAAMSSTLPPLTSDCCQTFATLSAVLLSSLGFAVMLSECCTTSTVNYLLYISAWMHQLTVPLWPSKGSRPTTSDLNKCLLLPSFFPSKVEETLFDVVFYNQPDKVVQLLETMCTPYTRKRPRNADAAHDVCGYVIVSGDYTVSVFSVCHDTKGNASSRYTEAWSFYICDSHGTQPWSQGKACLCGVTFGEPKDSSAPRHGHEPAASRTTLSKREGVQWFSSVLCILLEEHRKSVVTTKVPYMTWTPIARERDVVLSVSELVKRIDEAWVPHVLSNPTVKAEAKKLNFTLRKCFIGMTTA